MSRLLSLTNALEDNGDEKSNKVMRNIMTVFATITTPDKVSEYESKQTITEARLSGNGGYISYTNIESDNDSEYIVRIVKIKNNDSVYTTNMEEYIYGTTEDAFNQFESICVTKLKMVRYIIKPNKVTIQIDDDKKIITDVFTTLDVFYNNDDTLSNTARVIIDSTPILEYMEENNIDPENITFDINLSYIPTKLSEPMLINKASPESNTEYVKSLFNAKLNFKKKNNE